MSWIERAKQEIRDILSEREDCDVCDSQKHAGRDDCWYCDGSPWEQTKR